MPPTPVSRTLRTFVQSQAVRAAVPLPVHTLLHTAVLARLGACTKQWRARPPEWQHTERCDTTRPHAHTLPVPSKVHVLRVLRDGCVLAGRAVGGSGDVSTARTTCADGWAAVVGTVDADALSRCVDQLHTATDATVRADGYHWLHANAHSVLDRLGTLRTKLAVLRDPVVDWCCEQWRRYPDLYDYFVPLDVQHAYEQQAACAQTTEWTWAMDGEPAQSYRLLAHVPHQSVDRRALYYLAYRITLMSLVDEHACTTLALQWFPVDRRKWVGAPVMGGKKAPRERGSRRRRLRRRTNRVKVTVPSPTLLARPDAFARSARCGNARCGNARCGNDKCLASTTWNPYQVNTGATYRGTCDTVTLWRREEATKTFLHEMMHGFAWDFEAPDTARAWVVRRFRVDPAIEIRFYESYVETWATLLNVYLAVVHDYNSADAALPVALSPALPSSLVALVRVALDDERRFAVFQVAKVLRHTGFVSWTAFVRGANDASGASDTPVFHQTTSVFSYYIVRAMHLWDLDWFVRTFSRVRYDANPDANVDAWLQHLDAVVDDPAFGAAVDACFPCVHGAPEVCANTMRMTCVEALW